MSEIMESSKIKLKKFKSTNFHLVSLFLMLFSSTVFMQSNPINSEVLTLRTTPWALNVLAAIFIVLSLVALGYMISKVFGIKELSTWSLNEFYQIVMLSFLIFLIFGMLKIENIVFDAYGMQITGSENPAIDNAVTYLVSVRSYLIFIISGLLTEKTVLSVSNSLVETGLNTVSGKFTSILKASEIFSKLMIFKIDLKDTAKAIVKTFSSIIDLSIGPFSFVYGVNSMQIYFLRFINNLAFNFFLPFGLFFRVFSFTKKFGNTLIALAIAFYLVFPLTYLISQSIVDHVLNFGQTGTPYSWRNILSARLGVQNQNELTSFLDSGVSGVINKAYQAGTNFSSYVISFIFKFVFVLFNEVAFAFVLFTLIPIINFTITISIAKQIGEFLGSDISLTEVLKML